ncbi:MAG: hypothetical protein LBQ48_08185 [Oscillospiraceae bacterium]|jgi:hypothetical protein|nr:hypothetical protein [Oscillospiraceae bacterium]
MTKSYGVLRIGCGSPSAIAWRQSARLGVLRDVGYEGFLTNEREVRENPAHNIRMALQFFNNYKRYQA